MFKKSDPVSSTSKARANPFTPLRRFFFKLELLKPIVALGKRVRDQSHVADVLEHQPEKISMDYPSLGSSSFVSTTAANTSFIKDRIQQQTRQGKARIALQQHDQPLDAIVITTLPSYPFCCHEDLLMMSHSQLVEAAALLNSRLPACSQIEHADGIPDAHIRHSIETLVGIVPDMPGAPKAIKSRRFERKETDLLGDLEQYTIPSPPTSPLSMRVSRRQEKALPIMSSPPHLLGRLEEEDEDDFFTMSRPLKKKRKVARSLNSVLDENTEMGEDALTTPRHLQHHQQRVHGFNLEQQSSPNPISSPDVFKVDSTFINMKPRQRSMRKNSARTRKVASGGDSPPGSSRKSNTKKAKRDYREKKRAITLNYRSFEFPTNDSDRNQMRIKPSSSTSIKSSNSSDGKIVEDDWSGNRNSGISPVEHEDSQVAGGIENLTVGCNWPEMDV